MRKQFVFALSMFFVAGMCLVGCNNKDVNPNNNGGKPLPPAENVLNPEDAKERLANIGKYGISLFNPEEQEEAAQVAEEGYRKFQNFKWNSLAEQLEDRFGFQLGGKKGPKRDAHPVAYMLHYVSRVARATADPAEYNYTYEFDIDKESAVFEADDETQSWKEVERPAKGGGMVLRYKSDDGSICEAKVTAEGTKKEFQYTFETEDWDAPRIYFPAGSVPVERGYAVVNGEWYSAYITPTGWVYEIPTTTGVNNIVPMDESDVRDKYVVEPASGDWYTYFDEETQQWYKKDWDHQFKVIAVHTVKAYLPEKIVFTLKSGNTEISRVEAALVMERNKKLSLDLLARVANLEWTVNTDIQSTSAKQAVAMKVNGNLILGTAINLPEVELIGIEDGQAIEDWGMQYVDRYEELLKKIGKADVLFDILGEVQFKGNFKKTFAEAYKDFREFSDRYSMESEAGCRRFCNLVNEHLENGVYFKNDIKQAEMQFRPLYVDEEEGKYEPEMVICFSDGTTYNWLEYLYVKKFTDFESSIETLANKYIGMSDELQEMTGGEFSLEGDEIDD